MLKLKILFNVYKEIIAFIILVISFFFNYWNNLTKYDFSLNIIQILIIIFWLLIINKIILDINNKSLRELRVENFYKNWCNFKTILIKHKNWILNLEKEYWKIRHSLQKDMWYFSNSFLEIKKNEDPKYNWCFIELINLEECIWVREIKDWENKVKRRIPDELDCFDNMILKLNF